MQILIKISLSLFILTNVYAGGSGTSSGNGGGPGMSNDILMRAFSGSGQSGGGVGFTMSDEEFGAELRANFERSRDIQFPGEGSGYYSQLVEGPSMTDEEIDAIWLKDAVDVRLENDEVLDIEQLQDRFGSDVVKVGDEVQVSNKLPIADFQNYSGEIIEFRTFEVIQN